MKELQELHEDNEIFGGEDEDLDENTSIAEDIMNRDMRQAAKEGYEQTMRELEQERVKGEPDDTSNLGFTARSSGDLIKKGKQGSQNRKGGNRGTGDRSFTMSKQSLNRESRGN